MIKISSMKGINSEGFFKKRLIFNLEYSKYIDLHD